MTASRATSTVFRECIHSDLPAVQLLVDQLYASDPNTEDLRPNVTPTFNELMGSPEKGRLIVFENSDNIVGYCIVIFFWSNEYGGNIIEIDELYIVEHMRASGIGTAVFNWLEEHFADKLAGFSFQVAYHNEPMLRFAKKAGFSVSRNQHMIRIIPSSS